MSNLEFKCTSCGKTLRCSPLMLGKSISCPACQSNINLPSSSGPEPGPEGQPSAQPAVQMTETAKKVELHSYTVRAADGATSALVCGILGLFCFGVILGPVAIAQGIGAIKQIDANPKNFTGRGMATAGLVLGCIDLIGFAIGILMMISRR